MKSKIIYFKTEKELESFNLLIDKIKYRTRMSTQDMLLEALELLRIEKR